MPKIKGLLPWFGSKRTIAPAIVEELGAHRAYWEPFCGCCAVLFAKEPVRAETVNDLHRHLINLVRVLADEQMARDLYSRLSRLIFHEDLFRESKSRLAVVGHLLIEDGPSVQAAFDMMVCSWFGRNGVVGTKGYNNNLCVRYTSSGGHAATRWFSAVSSIPDWHYRLRGVTILNKDAFEILERIEDSEGTAIYCDPPYLTKAKKYVHDFESEDHKRLAHLLQRFRYTRVVVSYYDDPRLADLYPGWKRRMIDVTKAMTAQNLRDQSNTARATEVLLINDRVKRLF